MRQPENARKNSQDDSLAEDFLTRMNESTAYWQQRIAAIAHSHITEIEHPSPKRIQPRANPSSYPFGFISQLMQPVWRRRRKPSSTPGKTKTTGPRVTIIAPGVELIEGEVEDLPDTAASDCTPPDTKSESTFNQRFQKGG